MGLWPYLKEPPHPTSRYLAVAEALRVLKYKDLGSHFCLFL